MPILEPKRNFLKVNEVEDGDAIEFANAGEWVESKKWTYADGTPKQQFIIGIKYKGQDRDMSLNTTSRDSLVGAFGRDTEKWIGQQAMIELVKQNIGGTLKNVIYLSPVLLPE